jgi:hypothetical protein
VFTVVRVKRHLRFSDGWLEGTMLCIKFYFELGKTASEMQECSEQLLVTMPWGEHRLLSVFFLIQTWGKL